MLVPFGARTSLLGKAYLSFDEAVTKSFSSERRSDESLDVPKEQEPLPFAPEKSGGETEAYSLRDGQPFRDIIPLPANQIWIIWLAAAAGIMIRKVTAYGSFAHYIKIGSSPVCDEALLDRLPVIASKAGVKKPVELCVNPLVSSPMLTGFFRPCIVLKSTRITEAEFTYTVMHELKHFSRRDILYKWLVQVTVCLHWFNPLVYIMSREIAKDCEFSCDEAILSEIGRENAREYGKTLLEAAAAAGKRDTAPEAVNFSKNNGILKERLSAIMNYNKKTGAVKAITCMLTLSAALGVFFTGTYPVEAKAVYGVHEENAAENTGSVFAADAEKYYNKGSLPLFGIAFSRMGEKEQSAWLERIYEDYEIGFFGTAVRTLNENSPLIEAFAEKFYGDGEIAFFSQLADIMSDDKLKRWLERALEDESLEFQSMLFDRLDKEEEKDLLEEKLTQKQTEEYKAAGVTRDGKNYYYRGQKIAVFLDMRSDKSFYTLEINPDGKVNVKIIRGEDGKIIGAELMPDSEAEELLEDLTYEEEEREDGGEITVPIVFDVIESGAYTKLGNYKLDKNDRVSYHVTAENGSKMAVGFTKSNAEKFNVTYNTVSNVKIDEVLKIETDNMDWNLSSGEYGLFIHAAGADLTGVKGYVTIIKSGQAM